MKNRKKVTGLVSKKGAAGKQRVFGFYKKTLAGKKAAETRRKQFGLEVKRKIAETIRRYGDSPGEAEARLGEVNAHIVTWGKRAQVTEQKTGLQLRLEPLCYWKLKKEL